MPSPAFYLPPAEAFVGRTTDWTFDLYQIDGAIPLVIQATDNVRFKLSAAETGPASIDADSRGPFSATFSADAGTDTVTSVNHGLQNDQVVTVASTGSLPGGLTAGTNYYVRAATSNTFQLSTAAGGTALDLTTNGAGTMTWTAQISKVTVATVGAPATTPARVTVRLHQLDTARLTPGDYFAELLLIDDDDGDLAKPVCRFPVTLKGSATGELSLA